MNMTMVTTTEVDYPVLGYLALYGDYGNISPRDTLQLLRDSAILPFRLSREVETGICNTKYYYYFSVNVCSLIGRLHLFFLQSPFFLGGLLL